jgi:CBS domain-containing protein
MIDTTPISEILVHKGSTVWSIAPESNVFDAIQMMAEKNIGAVAVIEHHRLIGLLTERDYTRKVVLRGKASKTTHVREILNPHIISVAPEHTVQECLQLMTEHRIRHLPVLKQGQLAGIISIGDLVNWIISAQRSQIEQLQTYISGVPA